MKENVVRRYSFPILLLASLHALAVDNTATNLVSDEVVVTATRFEDRSGIAPTLETIHSDEIQASGERFLPDLLKRQAGILTRDNSASPDKQVDLRGFGMTGDQNTVILVDGQRLSENELATASWTSIPLDSIERIEIVRGSASVLYGAGAVAGVINIITRHPRRGAREATVSGGIGNYATGELRAGATLANDSMGLTLAANHYESNNYRFNNALSQEGINFGFDTLGTGPRLGLRLAAERQALRLPGARTATELITDRRGATTPDDYANRESQRIGAIGVVPVGEGEFRIDMSYRSRDTNSVQVLAGDVRTILAASDNLAVSPRIRMPVRLGEATFSTILGIDWADWNYTGDSSSSFGLTRLSSSQQTNALYAQEHISLPSATQLMFGGRLHKVHSSARDAASTQPYASGSQDKHLRAYEIQIQQEFGKSLSAYVKRGQSFRLATVDEVYAPFGGPAFDAIVTFLEPQVSRDYEVGVRAGHGATQGRLSLYRMLLTNEIHFDPVSFTNTNYPPSERFGAEMDGQWQLAPRVHIAGNLTYARARFRSGSVNGTDVAGKDVPLVPRLKANLQVALGFSDTLTGYVAENWVSTQYLDNDESNTFFTKIPAFKTVDTRLEADFGRWSIAGEIRNLFNAKYYTYGVRSLTSTRYNSYPASERILMLSAKMSF